ncbi:hypothetical protein N0B31_09435 [Salinirubellus salinus]|uniref:Uncharacterized protein n=1 Tax=Salinirubellus salinus TaxID=1364945 RepID=A0A9E7R8I0_9EURY|nr:hypothetical protein [Salinirubellus salinus]UWM56498.1 hypothetical protein N0B31_09435 [Salinirubellus salinus]
MVADGTPHAHRVEDGDRTDADECSRDVSGVRDDEVPDAEQRTVEDAPDVVVSDPPVSSRSPPVLTPPI